MKQHVFLAQNKCLLDKSMHFPSANSRALCSLKNTQCRPPGYPLRPGTSSRAADNSPGASAYELMSVKMTSTCMPLSYARYSAAVSAIRGAMIVSMVGSLARFKNKTVRSMEPFSSKSCANVKSNNAQARNAKINNAEVGTGQHIRLRCPHALRTG